MLKGHIIFLNGTSSSGKSRIATLLQKKLEKPYMIIALDDFLNRFHESFLSGNGLRDNIQMLLDGFNASIAATAGAGINIIVDHVLQEPAWADECMLQLSECNVTYVGVKCPLQELEKREAERGDRQKGLVRYQFDKVHQRVRYDIEVDTYKMSAQECADFIGDTI